MVARCRPYRDLILPNFAVAAHGCCGSDWASTNTGAITNGTTTRHECAVVSFTPAYGVDMTEPLHTSLHRTAKYFMDSGRVQTTEEAMDLLKSFGLTIAVGPEIQTSQAAQIALLTLVNLARRTFLAGVEIVGLADAPVLTRLAVETSLADAVSNLGGRVVSCAQSDWPVVIIGSVQMQTPQARAWRVTWQGWRAGVVPVRDGWAMNDDAVMPLAPALAAAVCAAEVFALHAGDHPLAGQARAAGLSLWRPGSDWTEADETEPALAFLPSRLWLIGLGNLGQAYSWLLACSPHPANGLELVSAGFRSPGLSQRQHLRSHQP